MWNCVTVIRVVMFAEHFFPLISYYIFFAPIEDKWGSYVRLLLYQHSEFCCDLWSGEISWWWILISVKNAATGMLKGTGHQAGAPDTGEYEDKVLLLLGHLSYAESKAEGSRTVFFRGKLRSPGWGGVQCSRVPLGTFLATQGIRQNSVDSRHLPFLLLSSPPPLSLPPFRTTWEAI